MDTTLGTFFSTQFKFQYVAPLNTVRYECLIRKFTAMVFGIGICKFLSYSEISF